MLQKSTIPSPLPYAVSKRKKSGRGRPRKPVEPDALLPFRKHEVTKVKQFNNLEKKLQPEEIDLKKKRKNPTTSDRNYTADEVEFMNALEEFKRACGKVFPTCSEILGILRSIGYEKVSKEPE